MAKKVLVVDDEKLIVKGVRYSLEQDGMEVDCAYDGEEALQKIKDKEYDIIIIIIYKAFVKKKLILFVNKYIEQIQLFILKKLSGKLRI